MDAMPNLILAHPLWMWLAVGAIFLAVEVMTGSGWLLWPAGSAAVVAVATLLVAMSEPIQIALFAACTIASTYVGRRFLRGNRGGTADVNNPLSRLVGHRGEVARAFEGEIGRVFVDGKEWSAELEGAESLAAGSKVEVTGVVGGAKLKVRAG